MVSGMKTCGFAGGFRGWGELEEAGADYLIKRFGELRKIVEGYCCSGRWL